MTCQLESFVIAEKNGISLDEKNSFGNEDSSINEYRFVIDVPELTRKCPNGRKLHKNGKCRKIF